MLGWLGRDEPVSLLSGGVLYVTRVNQLGIVRWALSVDNLHCVALRCVAHCCPE